MDFGLNPGLVGYSELSQGTYTAYNCANRITSLSYARCHGSKATETRPIVACIDKTFYTDDGGTTGIEYTCGPTDACRTKTIYPTLGASSWLLDFDCWSTSTATLLLTPPAGAVVFDAAGNRIVVGTTTPTLTLTRSTVSTTADPATSPNRTTGPTSIPSPASDGGNAARSKAWIAGAVIGPIAALLIIAGLAFCVYRLKKRGPAERYEYREPGSEKEAVFAAELPIRVLPVEMPER